MTVGFVPNGTSGRNTTGHKASRLNSAGVYSIVRNPLYLANGLMLLGISLLPRVWIIPVLVVAMLVIIYIPIILSEEAFLTSTFGESYQDYASRVPCLLPNPRLWKAPDLKWSLRMVIRREHDSIYSLFLAFIAVEVCRRLAAGTFELNITWAFVLGVPTALWLVAEFLKKFTNTLRARAD